MATVPEFLECPLCFEVFTQVVETPCCHRCFCLACIKDWHTKKNECPNCRNPLATIEACVPNIPFQRLVDDLPAKCDNADAGCKDKITRGIIQDHLKNCGFAIVKCQFAPDTCESILRKDLEKHKQECQYRPQPCPNCSTIIPFNLLEKHTKDDCTHTIVNCTNPECTATGIIRSNLKNHVDNECLFSLIFCPFSKFGICKGKIARGELENHYKENPIEHINLALKLLEKRDVENAKFLARVEELQKSQFSLELGVEQLSDLKPKLTFQPLSIKSIPLVLPSFLILDENAKRVAYLTGDNLNIVGIKQVSKSLFTFSSMDKSDSINVIVTADRPVPPISRFSKIPYYFEITVRSKDDPGILFGFIDDSNGNNKGVLGKIPQSYALEVYNQRLFGPSISSKAYCGTKTPSGTYGCGWDQNDGVIFFVVDENCGGSAFRNVKGNLKPAICFTSTGVEVFVNLGVSRFLWDVKKYWEPFRNIEVEVHKCVETRKCTYNATGTDYFPQAMYHCKECNLEQNFGMCEVCAKVCHAGHTVSSPTAAAGFFCDCGHLTADKKRAICKCLH